MNQITGGTVKKHAHSWVRDEVTGDIGIYTSSNRCAVIHFCNTSIVVPNNQYGRRFMGINAHSVPRSIECQLSWMIQD